MKKALKISLSVIVAFFVILFILVQSWRQTPYGELDYKVAVLLKLANSRESGNSKNISAAKTDYLAVRKTVDKYLVLLMDKPIDLPVVQDIKIPGPAGEISARVYKPKVNGAMPIIIYYHGGGWIAGSLNTHDSPCRKLAQKTGAVVISVDYRLAPENKFPAAVDDAYAALIYASRYADKLGGDAAKIAVAGDSAGGNLAAAVALMARDKNGPQIAHQILIYPVTNISSTETQSYNNFASGYSLTKSGMQNVIASYAKDDADKKSPYASPLLASDFRGLPPAIVLTVQFDPLRDEGEAYADKLIAAHVPVVKKRFNGTIHGFMSLSKITDDSDVAMAFIADTLNKAYQK